VIQDCAQLIHVTEDAAGPVQVYQQGLRLYLTFGNQVEQSCMNLAAPHSPEHVYVQAMLLAPLLQAVMQRVLVLGLGGGSLVRALGAIDFRLGIDAVEQRQSVIEIAESHFGVRARRNLKIHCCDAGDFLLNACGGYDLIFADLYLAEGMHPLQAEQEFLQCCRDRLDSPGLLVANLWGSELREAIKQRRLLEQVFEERVLYLHAQGGNVIAFAFVGQPPALDRKGLYEKANELGQILMAPMQRHARNFWRQNAEGYLRIRRSGMQ
jgi:spermidine synthase